MHTAFPVHLDHILALQTLDSAHMALAGVKLGPFRRRRMWCCTHGVHRAVYKQASERGSLQLAYN